MFGQDAWTREFKWVRDGSAEPAASAFGRLQRGGGVHLYDLLSSKKILAQLRVGHLRAALLAGARDPKAIAVKILFRYQSMSEAAIFAPELRGAFESEHFHPNLFEIHMKGIEGHFLVSFFTAQVFLRAYKEHTKCTRSGSS
ncbi:MAG: hypothetical protein AAB480_01895 [Patescibacteria group bacterium]